MEIFLVEKGTLLRIIGGEELEPPSSFFLLLLELRPTFFFGESHFESHREDRGQDASIVLNLEVLRRKIELWSRRGPTSCGLEVRRGFWSP